MFIESLKLENYRGFDKLDITFSNLLTLFVGVNGAGKSSILDAIGIAASSFLSNIPNAKVIRPSKNDVLSKTITYLDSVENQAQYPMCITAEGTVCGETIEWSRSLQNTKSTGYASKEYEAISNISEKVNKLVQNGSSDCILPLIAYYGTGRLWNSATQNTSKNKSLDTNSNLPNRFDAYKDCIDAHLDVSDLEKWFKHMTLRELQEKKRPLVYGVVKSAIETSFKALADAENISVEFSIAKNQITVKIDFKNGQSELRLLSELSDGYRSALCLIADIAYRLAVLNPQLGGNVLKKSEGIVLIDEIDLHLHPAWQRVIISNLITAFPNLQFIVSTHAPAVIGTVSRENLFLLNGGVVQSPEIEIYGRDVNSVLNCVMEVSERPPETEKLFKELYKYLDSNDYEKAENVLKLIEDKTGGNDPEATSLSVRLDLERM